MARHHLWRVGRFPREVVLATRSDGGTAAGGDALSPEHAAWQVEAWFPEDAVSRELLLDIAAAVGRPPLLATHVGTAELRDVVRGALRSGLLDARRVQVPLSGGSVAKVEEQPSKPPEPPAKEVKTWIAIELVDDSDPPKPVPFKRYRIELPDFSVREGTLDENGRARVDGIDPGMCNVSFPQLHADDWKQA